MVEPLFNYRLRDLHDVKPWSDSNIGNCLSWYGLSDGWYWLRCGEDELFRATPEILARWNVPSEPCYCDYYVARLWEDVLQMLPEILNPVPLDLAKYISGFSGEDEWESKCAVWITSDDEFEEFGSDCLDWVNRRRLSTLYLKQGPIIRIWRLGDTVRVLWDNSMCQTDGIRVWTSVAGLYELPVDEFVREVKSFNDRFISDMSARVASITSGWNRPNIRIDLDQVLANHAVAAGALDKALSQKSETDWDEVRVADRILTEKMRMNPARN